MKNIYNEYITVHGTIAHTVAPFVSIVISRLALIKMTCLNSAVFELQCRRLSSVLPCISRSCLKSSLDASVSLHHILKTLPRSSCAASKGLIAEFGDDAHPVGCKTHSNAECCNSHSNVQGLRVKEPVSCSPCLQHASISMAT